ncbi:sigma-70 family RNA polymerase sigma factor [Nostoc sp. FACHB-190]|uniref:sigma-70 family RNA polymerase sigma factor n=1 Tax=Nostoc sp. FACHB-190 TaxID=2692838 RepID=UPI0016885088|nr:sigma-70 family RNA polymerase sigma factor [Nostoc sp. FACHB-190]MBD2302455.1 sigma-70 family RNA polymerase sigma factor [Nostoc sp. FACHB-190]
MSNDFSLTDDAINQELQQLVYEVRRYPANSKNPQDRAKRRIALNKLINAIRCSGKLSKQGQWMESPNYEDYYHEALQITFVEICQKIEQYNPEYPVMVWVNIILARRISDVAKKDQKRGITQLPKHQKVAPVLALDELNKDVPIENEIYSEQQQLKEVIENDPENILKDDYIHGYPQANLKAILLLVLEGKRWKDISEELGVSISTASSFYQRRMRKTITYLKKYI